MKKENLLLRSFITYDSALLFLRVSLGALIFTNHGYEKLFHFEKMYAIFPDPIGIGKLPGLIFALITDGILPVFLIFGLFTRLSAFLIAANLSVAFFIVHKANVTEIHGELAMIFLATAVLLFLCGAGNKSIDAMLVKGKSALGE